MKYQEICQKIADQVKPESTSQQVIHRLTSLAATFAVEELRNTPANAFRPNLNREDIKNTISALKEVLSGIGDLQWIHLNEFNFTFLAKPNQIEVRMVRTCGGTRNWPNTASFMFDFDAFTADGKCYVTKVSQNIYSARERFHDLITSNEPFELRTAAHLYSFLNFFTTSPEAMMRHGYMLCDDIYDAQFCGVKITPIKKKGTDIIKGVSLKFLHLSSDPLPEIYIEVTANKDTPSTVPMYDMRGAEDYDEAA